MSTTIIWRFGTKASCQRDIPKKFLWDSIAPSLATEISPTPFKAGFIDAWGRGYKKIRDGFTKAGIPMPKVANSKVNKQRIKTQIMRKDTRIGIIMVLVLLIDYL